MKRLIILFMLVQVTFFYCTLDIPDDPKAPKWDIEIEKIPLLKADTLRLGDRFDLTSFKRSGADSILSFEINDEKKMDLQDKLKTPAQQHSFSDQLGEIVLNVNRATETDISFTEIYPDLPHLLGTDAIIPATEISPVEESITLEDFSSISIVSGGVTMDVTNRLGFALNGDVKLDLIDEGRGNVLIETINLQELEDGQTASFFVDLGGTTISNQLKAIFYGTLNGSNGQVVFIPFDSGIYLVVTPMNIVVNEATAKIPSQEMELTGSININSDSLRVRQAKVKSGSINISIFNEFDFNIDIFITIPNILDENNKKLQEVLSIPSKSKTETSIFFNNTSIDLENKNLAFDIKLTIYPESDRMYTIRSTDEISVDIDVSEIWFESVTGDFDLGVQFPEIQEMIFEDRSEEIENFGFHDVILTFAFINSPSDLDIDVIITAIKNGMTKQLPINISLSQNDSVVLSRDGINNDHSTPTIIDLINILPDEIIISGDVRVKGENVTITNDDKMRVKYNINFPFIFSANQADFSYADSLKIETGMRDFLRDNTISAGMTLSLENGLPISGMLSLSVGPDTTDISSTILAISLPKPTLTNGIVTTPGVTTLNIGLNKPQFLAIANGNFYQFDVTIDNVKEAAITAKNYLVVRDVFISGSFLFDPEGMTEDNNGGKN